MIKTEINNFLTLINKVISFLNTEWKVDRYVCIKILRVDTNGITFELYSTMDNVILEKRILTWEEMNELA